MCTQVRAHVRSLCLAPVRASSVERPRGAPTPRKAQGFRGWQNCVRSPLYHCLLCDLLTIGLRQVSGHCSLNKTGNKSINEQKGSEEQMSRYAEHLAQSTDVLRQAPQLWRNHTDPPASNSVVQLFVTPWTVVHQAPLSMEFSREEHWSGLAIPFSRGPFQPRDQTQVSFLHCRQILYHLSHQGNSTI